MTNRRLREFGVHPIVGYVAALGTYIIGSYYLFEATELAAYIYSFIALFFVGRLSEVDRNDFLKSINTASGLRRLRLSENLLVAFPFLALLLYKQAFSMFPAVLLIAALMALINIRTSVSRSFPTPFSKRPFEFSTGFRRTWPIFILSYFLTYMAIATPNFGIGILALIFIFFTCASYYSQPENEFFVWVFARTPNAFLLHKIKIALFQLSLLCLPIIVALSISFLEEALVLIPIMALFYIYLATLIYAKYSAFPEEMSVPQGLLYALSMVFPPVLLFSAPYFFRKSNDNLSTLLK